MTFRCLRLRQAQNANRAEPHTPRKTRERPVGAAQDSWKSAEMEISELFMPSPSRMDGLLATSVRASAYVTVTCYPNQWSPAMEMSYYRQDIPLTWCL